jgi:two-component system sensor histidine kinase UhpB
LKQCTDRAKSLMVLHCAVRILHKQPNIMTVLNELAAVLPAAFQHPAITAVCLRLGNKEVTTRGFFNSPQTLRAEFVTADSLPGSVEVVYNNDASSGNMPAFVDEEQVLLTTFADMIRIAYDRWQTEERLQLSEERYRTFVKASSLIDWTTDADAHFCHMSGWVDLTGQTEEHAAGDGWLEVIHPEDRAKAARVWEESDATQTPYINEYRLRTKQGSYRNVITRGVPIIRDGKVREWIGAIVDITERKEAEESLKATTAQVRALSARLELAREEEGTRIARELHDELGSVLSMMKWELELLEHIVTRAEDITPLSHARQKLITLKKTAEAAIGSVRRISSELRPGILDDLGLIAAVEWQAEQFQMRTGILCQVKCPHECIPLTDNQGTAIFRIVQEALTNVLRHSSATRVDINIEHHDNDLFLSITDNGKGITPEEKRAQHSLGLAGMRERAHIAGGEISIISQAGKGTTVAVRVRLRNGL